MEEKEIMEPTEESKEEQSEFEAVILDDGIKEENNKEKKKNKKSGWKYELFDLARTFLICLVLVLLINHFLVNPVKVEGDSMYPTLQDEEIGFMNVFLVKHDGIQRQDVVIAHNENTDENWVKRVIGLPGDTIYAKDDVVYINDHALAEPYLDTEYVKSVRNSGKQFTYDFGPVTLKEDEYFLMGDNRIVSLDSREAGPFKGEEIIGKDVYVILPFDEMKLVRNGSKK